MPCTQCMCCDMPCGVCVTMAVLGMAKKAVDSILEAQHLCMAQSVFEAAFFMDFFVFLEGLSWLSLLTPVQTSLEGL